MGKYLASLSIIWLLCVHVTFGQPSTPNDSLSKNEVFADIMPEYPGGNEALYTFIGNHFKYPKTDRKNGVEGRVVTKFMIDTNGYVQNITIIKSLSPTCDAEARRVLALMPRWKPGKSNGKTVNVYMTLPIKVELEKEKPLTFKQELIAESVGAVVGFTLTLILVGWYRRTF